MSKKLIIYAVLAVLAVLGFIFLSEWVGGLIGAVLVAVGLRQSKVEKAKENINQAGEEYKAKEHDAKSAREKLDKIIGDQNEKD